MAYNIGQGTLQVVPSFKGVAEAIDAEAARWGESAGNAFGSAFREAVDADTADLISSDDAEAAEKGSSAGGAFADAFRARVDAALATLPDADIGLNMSEFDAELLDIRAELETLRDARIGVDISDTDAMAKLAELKLALEEIGHSSESISVRVDTSAAVAELAALNATEGGAGGGGAGGLAALGGEAESSAGEITGLLVPALGLLATALVPIAGLAGGALSAVPAVLGGLGVGFGAVYLGIQGVLPAITAYRATLNETGKTAAQVATDHRNLVNAMAGLTPAGQTFVAFVAGQLLPVFDGLKTAVQGALLPGLATGLQAMLPFFQALQPFIVQAAQGIGETFTQLGRFIGSATGLRQINTILSEGNGFMSKMGDAAVTLFEAFTSIGAQAKPIVQAIGDGILHMVDAFSHWAEGGGFQGFLNWLRANGPGIVRDVEDIAKSIGKLVVMLTPLGEIVLHVVAGVAKFIAAVVSGNPVMDKLVIGLGAAAGAFWVLNAAMDANPIVLIVGAVVALGFAIEELVTHWSTVWGKVKQIFDEAVRFLRSGFGTLVLLITGPFAPLLALALHWQQVWSLMQTVFHGFMSDVASPLVNFFTQSVPHAFDVVVSALHPLLTAWTTVWNGVKAAMTDAWSVVHPIFDLIKIAGLDYISANVAILRDAWNAAWSVMSSTIGVVEGVISVVSAAIGFAIGGVETVIGDLKSAWDTVWGDIKTVVGDAWNFISGIFTNIINGVNAVQNALHTLSFGLIPGATAQLPAPSGGINIGNLGGGNLTGRASGGDVLPGTPYWVGEHGPEIYVPDAAGTILSASTSATLLSSPNNLSLGAAAPVMHVEHQSFHNEAEIEGLMRQASFFRRARRL